MYGHDAEANSNLNLVQSSGGRLETEQDPTDYGFTDNRRSFKEVTSFSYGIAGLGTAFALHQAQNEIRAFVRGEESSAKQILTCTNRTGEHAGDAPTVTCA